MALPQKKFSDLTPVSSLNLADIAAVLQAGEVKGASISDIINKTFDEIDNADSQDVLADAMTFLIRNAGDSEKTTLAILSNYIKGQTLSKHIQLSVVNNASNPTYQLDVSADELQIGAIREIGWGQPTALVMDKSVQGVNGRDQVAAFSASSWVYTYAIAGAGKTSALVSSASPTAPDLATIAGLNGYTEYIKIDDRYIDASSNFRTMANTDGTCKYSSFFGAFACNDTTDITSLLTGYLPTADALLESMAGRFSTSSSGTGNLTITGKGGLVCNVFNIAATSKSDYYDYILWAGDYTISESGFNASPDFYLSGFRIHIK